MLDLLHRGRHPEEVAATLGLSTQTVFNIKRRYVEEGFDSALQDKPRSGKPPRILSDARAKLTALACATAPEGHARSTLRLLADRAVTLGFVDSISHNLSSFYENLPPEQAFALAQRFEMHYTPKKGSWLNMAELELSALSRICLSRRISSIEELDGQVQALVKERNELKVKVEWQFTITQAREKLSRRYENVKSKN
jgi:hypothetical protein